MDLKQQFTKEVNKYLDYLIGQLKNNKEFLAGMSVGAFLATPAGKKILANTAHFSKQLASLTKEVGANTAKELWNMAVTSKLGKTNFATSAIKGEGKVGKFSEGMMKTSAAMIAGKAIGASIGKTIAAGDKWWQHVNPISATIDIVNVLKEEHDEKKAKNKQTQEKVKELATAIPNYSASGEANKISVYTGFDYDEEAKKLGLSARPTNKTAENQWKKEVEKQMKKTGKSIINDKSWYDRGEARKISAGTLTWSAVKTNSELNGYPFVAASAPGVVLTMPMENSAIHPRVKQNINVLFQALRGKNTGAYQYEEEDVFNYVYALSSLIARIRYMQKVLRLANVHNVLVENLHIALTDLALDPISLPSGAVYNDIVKNAPNYISRLNSLAEEINTYALPGNTLISRWNYLMDKGFRDYNGMQAAYCFYKLAIWPKFQVNAALITPANFSSLSPLTPYDSALAQLETDVHVFRTLGAKANNDYSIASNVMVKISGDMIKLLGADKKTFMNVPYYTGNPVQTFEYDIEAIDQLRNAKIYSLFNMGYADYSNPTLLIQTQLKTVSGSIQNFLDTNKTYNDGWLLTSERNIGASGPENVQLTQFFWNARAEMNSSDATEAYCTMEDVSASFIAEVYSEYYTPGTRTFSMLTTYQFEGIGTTNRVSINGNATNATPIKMLTTGQLDYLPKPELIDDNATVTAVGQAVDVDNFCYISKRQFRELLNVAAYSLTYYFDPSALNINGLI